MMVTDVVLEEAVRLVEEGLSVTLPVSGWSMLPFIIGGRESVILSKPDRVVRGDVVLAWIPPLKPVGNSPQTEGRYVVHRIIRIEGEKVTLMGDGNLVGTECCTLSDIRARVTHVVGADEQPHDLYAWWRRFGAKVWWHLRPVRRYLLAIYRKWNIKN